MDLANIDQRLYDLLSGSLSPDEVLELQKWIDADVENYRYFQEFKRGFLYMRWNLRSSLIQGDFDQFQRRLERRNHWMWVKRLVALVLLLLTVGGGVGYFYVVTLPDEEPYKSEPCEINPGKPQAILELSSGKLVKLGNLSGEMQEEHGVAVCVSPQGVSYRFSDSLIMPKNLYNRLSIPKGGEYMLTLSDGTRVWLNADTKFRYPLHFSGANREVYLKGEAYFEVAADSILPFIVKADELEVMVYGTCFNVNNYHSNQPEVVLAEGSVGMKISDEEIRLEPGQKGRVEAGQIFVEQVDVASYIAWKNGDFIFDNERLEDIMEKLSRWYNVEIFYQHEAVRDIRLSGDLRRYKEIQSLLYYFERISDVRFVVRENTILIKLITYK